VRSPPVVSELRVPHREFRKGSFRHMYSGPSWVPDRNTSTGTALAPIKLLQNSAQFNDSHRPRRCCYPWESQFFPADADVYGDLDIQEPPLPCNHSSNYWCFETFHQHELRTGKEIPNHTMSGIFGDLRERTLRLCCAFCCASQAHQTIFGVIGPPTCRSVVVSNFRGVPCKHVRDAKG
jgi:hypothetical protein